MNTKNMCDSPTSGYFAECDKYDKNGNHSIGVGKATYDVTYFSKSQDTEFTYQMCTECTNLYRDYADEDIEVVEVKII
jgi:hypothetical protein